MEQSTGSPPIYLVASTPEPRHPALGHSRLACEAAGKLEECRSLLAAGGRAETVHLLDIVLLQLRMEMRGISENDLNALCTALTEAEPAQHLLRDADGR